MKIKLVIAAILTQVATLTATVTDDTDQPLAGQTVTFTGENGITVDPVGVTDANGQVSVQASGIIGNVTATTADGVSVTASVVFPIVPVAPISTPTSSDDTVVQPAVTSELDKFKARVAAIVAFVEHGVEVFGKDAEADLLAFKDKYL